MAYPWCEFFWLFRPLMVNGGLGSVFAIRCPWASPKFLERFVGNALN